MPIAELETTPGPVATLPRNHGPSSNVARHLQVLHVINGEHYSGAERVQDLLAAGLPACGCDVGFACLKPDKFPAFRQYALAPLYLLPMRSRFDWRVVRQLTRIIARQEYDLVHAHTPRSAMIARAASAIAAVPMVYHVHSPTARDTTDRLRNTVNRWIERLSLVGVQGLITVSHSLKRQMARQGYPEQRLFAVTNGVPVPAVRRSASLPAAIWTVGTAALFRPRKGIEILLEAMARLKQQKVPVRLRAIGPFETPEYHQEILRRTTELGLDDIVDWTGFTRDVSTQLASLDLFVLPSLFGEGLPMVVLEAMAAGVPVVATRVEGVPEAIEDGVTGLLAEPSNPEDLARCIARVVRGHSNWEQLRERAIERHSHQFSDGVMAERVAAVYRQVLRGRQDRPLLEQRSGTEYRARIPATGPTDGANNALLRDSPGSRD